MTDISSQHSVVEETFCTIPLRLASGFMIDGQDYTVPMASESAQLAQAVTEAAQWVRRNDGFQTHVTGNLLIGQIHVPVVRDIRVFTQTIERNMALLLECANALVPEELTQHGAGAVVIKVRKLDRPDERKMAVLHLLCNPYDAAGAKLVNRMCAALRDPVEKLTGEKVGICEISNLVDTKLVEAICEIRDIKPEMAHAMQEASLLGMLDPYRATTHNKSVMDAIDAVLIATGNDWRAAEASVHAYAAQSGRYKSVTLWSYDRGILRGRLTAPLAAGTVFETNGGNHASALANLQILGIEHADQLARVCAAAGLANGLAALKNSVSHAI